MSEFIIDFKKEQTPGTFLEWSADQESEKNLSLFIASFLDQMNTDGLIYPNVHSFRISLTVDYLKERKFVPCQFPSNSSTPTPESEGCCGTPNDSTSEKT